MNQSNAPNAAPPDAKKPWEQFLPLPPVANPVAHPIALVAVAVLLLNAGAEAKI